MPRLAVILAACSLLAAGSAVADGPQPANQARLDSTVRYLQEAQNADGGFGGSSGSESVQSFSAWVALALAAAGINPRCQARPAGTDAYGFLVNHFHRGLEEEISYPSIPTTAFERELMVVNAAAANPHSFAGYDLVGEILARARADNGSFPYVPGGRGEINDTIFAIVSLAPVQEPAAQAAIQRAADWLIAQQDDDGGWSFEVRGGRTEADLTGAAIQALRAADRGSTEAEQMGLRYLRDMQNPDGGFPEFRGEAESNVASTAWAVQGIWSAGQDPEAWAKGGNEPLSYMASLQQPDGHIRWRASQDLNGVWMTAYVAPAFAGQAWPIPGSPCGKEPPVSAADSGQGEGSQSGSGTIAGGGGGGAPLFSRPKPQSRGRTPGGVRVLHGVARQARNHGKSRRGENAEQATGTETSEAGVGDADRPRHDSAQPGGGPSAADAGAASSSAGGKRRGGHEVVGTLIGGGSTGPGAPGLHGAGAADAGTPWQAIAIGAATLLFALLGSQLERRRGEVLL
jgi:prenyltransferase beta subunit